jgi:hypothetical protein
VSPATCLADDAREQETEALARGPMGKGKYCANNDTSEVNKWDYYYYYPVTVLLDVGHCHWTLDGSNDVNRLQRPAHCTSRVRAPSLP